MTKCIYKSIAAIFLFIFIGFMAACPASATDYVVIDLGTLGTSSCAYGINDSGQVVGCYSPTGDIPYYSFLYSGGSLIDLNSTIGADSCAYGINNYGQMVGFYTPVAGSITSHDAYLYSNGTITDLGTLGGAVSVAYSINDSGQIVGDSTDFSEWTLAFLYSGGIMTNLGGGANSAFVINNSGNIAGSSSVYVSGIPYIHAFLKTSSGMTDLGSLNRHSAAYGLNSANKVVGVCYATDASMGRAFLYDGRRMTDLGTLGGLYSQALSINDLGQIVGYSTMPGDVNDHAFLYASGQMVDINNIIPQGTGWELQRAYGINNKGQIVGCGLVNGQRHAFLLSPVCTYSIDTTGASFDSGSGSDSIQLNAQSGCQWTISNSLSWLTVTSGNSGSGSSTINYTVAANSGTSSRSGNFSIAGMNYSVTQAENVGAAPKGYTFCSNENQHCSFSGALSVAFGSNGKFAYKTLSNGTDCTTGIFGDPSPGAIKACFTKGANCSYTLSPNAKTFSSTSDTGSVAVTASSTKCTWTSVSNASWITITSGSSNTGSGTVTFSVAANTGSGSRTGTITIAGQTFTVTQAGLPQYSLTVSKADTGSGTVSSSDGKINCGSTCSSVYNSGATANLIASADNGSAFAGWSGNSCSGTGTCSVSMNSNTTVTASFVLCSFGISPSSISFTYSGGNGNATVSAASNGCSWTTTSNAAWITITSGVSGTGNGNVTYSIAANTSTSLRTGTITIAGQILTVTQSGIPQYALNISKSGTGTGMITSVDNTVNCGSTCSSIYNSGSSITLTATPDAGSTFTGWSGACSGTGTCTISMNANISVNAIFDKISPIQLTITSPADASTINGPSVLVNGTMTNTTGLEAGITVNGLPATIYGNQYIVNHVPLTAGTNTITITATDTAGNTTTKTMSVLAAISGRYIQLSANPESGISPLQTTLRLNASLAITNPVINVTGPAPVTTITSTNPDEYVYQMTTEGIYYFTAQAIGFDGNTYQDTVAVTVMNLTALDNLLKAKWTSMTNSLMHGDTTAALQQIDSRSKDAYKQMFDALAAQLPAITATQTGFSLISIENGIAKYKLVTFENGKSYSYDVIFAPDTNGVWMIQEF